MAKLLSFSNLAAAFALIFSSVALIVATSDDDHASTRDHKAKHGQVRGFDHFKGEPPRFHGRPGGSDSFYPRPGGRNYGAGPGEPQTEQAPADPQSDTVGPQARAPQSAKP